MMKGTHRSTASLDADTRKRRAFELINVEIARFYRSACVHALPIQLSALADT